MIRFLFLFLITLSIHAAPKDIEVWLLSNSKVSVLNNYLNRPAHNFGALTAGLQCQEMGDYCFDPQYGLYKKDDMFNETAPSKRELLKEGPSIPTSKSVDRDLIHCDSNNFFDVFCGKARPEAKKSQASLDVWIDTSGSMREFDFSDNEGGCNRKSFVKALDRTCGFNQKVNIMMFDTSIKQAGSMDQLCNNQGLNDIKRLMDWIERSEAKKLVIITDIYELHKDFADYIKSKNGSFRGDRTPLTSAQLVSLADELAKSCK